MKEAKQKLKLGYGMNRILAMFIIKDTGKYVQKASRCGHIPALS